MADFTVSREDWSFYRKAETDARRHREKVKEAIRNRLPEIITEESIILSNGQKVIRIPVQSVEEYRFRFNRRKMPHLGQGGGRQEGDLVLPGGGRGPGKGAGEVPGVDYYEAEVTVDEITEAILGELSLPYLDRRRKPEMVTEACEFSDLRKRGISANIDRRRTILSALKRNARQGRPCLTNIRLEDLRFRTWNVQQTPETSAAVVAMMDTSGSMGPFEKYIARSFFFWTVRFLRANYRNVKLVFLAHHTEAQETTEEEFFTKGESGGTRCSSVYELALRIIAERFPLQEYNIYSFHFSDGDNLTADNQRCVHLVRDLLEVASLVGYGEIEGPYYYTSTLKTAFRAISHPRFVTVTLRDKHDVYRALQAFFAPREG